MKRADMDHLRRLLGWVRCEIGQEPDAMVETVRAVAEKLGHPPIDDAARQRLVEAHDRARAVPKYVRAAVTALEKHMRTKGVVVEQDADETLAIGGPDTGP